ncbi:MAG TPA: TIGR02466 family protein [Caulobacter sp.]|nr:TIGR02466 family protein [Caulobacter sp.]
MTTDLLFATRIHRASLAADKGFPALHADLEDACRMMEAEDEAGRAWSRRNGYRGYTSYSSPGELWTRATAFGDLKRRLDRHAAAFARELGLDLGGGRLRMESFWVNVLKPGGGHSGHIHPHSVLSGTYYVALPPGAAGIRFEDPRLAMMMAAPMRSAEAPADQRAFVTIEPTAGDLLMWESWLRHEVPPSTARADRISISFNYGWR